MNFGGIKMNFIISAACKTLCFAIAGSFLIIMLIFPEDAEKFLYNDEEDS